MFSEPDFGKRRQSRTVLEIHRQIEVERLPEHRADRHVIPTQSLGGQRSAFVGVDQSDQTYANALNSVLARTGLDHLLDTSRERPRDRLRIMIMRDHNRAQYPSAEIAHRHCTLMNPQIDAHRIGLLRVEM